MTEIINCEMPFTEQVELVCGRPLSSLSFVKQFCVCRCEECEVLPTFQHILPCSCKFCDACYKHQNDTWISAECTVHKRRFRLSGVKSVQVDIEMMQVYCKNRCNGCLHFSTIRNIKNHEDLECCYKFAKCPLNCGNDVLLKDLTCHFNSVCPNQVEECSHCAEHVMKHAMETHLGICSKIPVVCHFCKTKVERLQVKTHEGTCEERPVSCRFREIGCSYTGKRSAVVQHETDEKHMDLLLENFRQLNDLKIEAERQRDDVHTEVMILKHLVETLEEKKNTPRDKLLEDFKNIISELKQVKEIAISMLNSYHEESVKKQSEIPDGTINNPTETQPKVVDGKEENGPKPQDNGTASSGDEGSDQLETLNQ